MHKFTWRLPVGIAAIMLAAFGATSCGEPDDDQQDTSNAGGVINHG